MHDRALRAAVEDLRLAIMDRGPRPHAHMRVHGAHRREWPTLWRAIERVLAVPTRQGTAAVLAGDDSYAVLPGSDTLGDPEE